MKLVNVERPRRASVVVTASALLIGIIAAGQGTAPAASDAPQAPAIVHMAPFQPEVGDEVIVAATNLTNTTRRITTALLDEDQNVLLLRRPMVAPGETSISTLMIDGADMQVRAMVSLPGGMPDQWAIAATLARGTTSGSTFAIISPRDPASGLPTGKRFAPTRVGSTQSLRFLVANLGTTTASFDIDVLNAAGGIVAEATIAGVAPGAIGYHSFPSVGQGVRRAVVTGPVDALVTLSEEVFDTATGRLDAYNPVCGCDSSR